MRVSQDPNMEKTDHSFSSLQGENIIHFLVSHWFVSTASISDISAPKEFCFLPILCAKINVYNMNLNFLMTPYAVLPWCII
jgi:hypothetical protein